MTHGIGPLAGLHIDCGADQSDRRAAVVEFDQGALGFVVVDGLAGQLAKRAELDQQSSNFRGIRHLAAHRAAFEVDVYVRHSRWRVEGGQEPRAQIAGQGKQSLVAGQLVAAEQSTQQTDRNLEILDVNVAIEGQVLDDVFACLRCLVIHAHQDHSVQSVDGGHEQRYAIPVVRTLAQRLERVVSPCVLLVAVPGVAEFLAEAFGHLGIARGM